ncbi:hypothetical protein LCGC14_3024890, partial [marine sediment metagenome]
VGRAAARGMAARGSGTIIFTGATAALRGGAGFINLAVGKFGLRALAQSMARELARINLPLSAYTEWIWKIDLHNLFHFLSLRMNPHAQYEIRVYADAMAHLISSHVPIACRAFKDYRLDAIMLIAQDAAAILVDTAQIGTAGAGLTNINLPNQTMDIVGSITGNLSGSVGSVTGAVGSVTGSVGSVVGNVGGNVVGTVASVVGAVGSVTGAVGSVTGAVGSVTGNVGGLVVGTVAGVTPAAVGAAMALTAGAVDAILDEAVEGAITLRQVQRVVLAYLAGETDGGGTVTIHFRNQADTLNRITMTVDADGDRSATALNLA